MNLGAHVTQHLARNATKTKFGIQCSLIKVSTLAEDYQLFV